MLAGGDGECCDGDCDRHSVHGRRRTGDGNRSGGRGSSGSTSMLCQGRPAGVSGGGDNCSASGSGLRHGDDLTRFPAGRPLYRSPVAGYDGGVGGAACGGEDGSASVLGVLVRRSGHVHVVRQHRSLASGGVSDDETLVSLDTWCFA